MFVLYSIVLGLGLLALAPLLWVRNAPDGRYTRHLGERLGRVSAPPGAGAIWLHAVSVGETLALERLIGHLKLRFPNRPVVLSVTTATGRSIAERRIDADLIFYFPLDFRFAVRRSLATIAPALVIITETEIWPNFLRSAASAGVPVMFLNGRISGRSYARYHLVRRLLRPVLAEVNGFLMQTPTDAARIEDLGARAERVSVAGNLKFDLVPPDQPGFIRWLRAAFARAGITQVIVAGSTMEGEEAQLLAVYRRLCAPQRLLLLAPRHPPRFDAVAASLAASGLPWAKRSRLIAGDGATVPAGGVLLLDSLGELASAYQLATLAFVGGTIAPHGGHNLLEPAFWGVPITFGPHMENFAAIAEQFLNAGAAHQVASTAELERVWRKLLDDSAERARLGAAARNLLASQRGATERALAAIAARLPPQPGLQSEV